MIRYIFLCALALVGTTADACSRKGGNPSLDESLADADEVFLARLVSATEKSYRDGAELESYIEGSYRLIEALKGKPARSGIVHDVPFGPGSCSLGLMVGWDYLFVVKRGEKPLSRWVGMFSGSFALGPYRDAEQADDEERDLVKVRKILNGQRETRKP